MTREEGIQSFNTMPLSGKHSAESLSEAGFFYTGKYFKNKCLLQVKNSILVEK